MPCFDRDRFDALQGEFCELDIELDVQPRGEYERVNYGDKGNCGGKLDDDHVWFMPSYTSGSDYSGNLVEVSNHRVLLDACVAADQDEDEVPDDCRPWFVDMYGGHGTFAIAIHAERAPDNIVEMLESLSNYPLLDDSDHSELEMEKQNEAWDNGVRDDYRKALEIAFESALEVFADRHGLEIETNVDLSDVSDSDISSHFWHWSNEANEYWSNEEGDSVWINVEKVAEAAAEELFTDPEAKPKGWDWPEGIPSNIAPVFTDPRQMLLPFKEGFPERYVPPPETRAGPAPLTAQESALIEEMIRLGWYKKDDREGQIAHIMRMRAAAAQRAGRGGMNGLEGMSAGELCVRVRRAPRRARLMDLPSWNRKLGGR